MPGKPHDFRPTSCLWLMALKSCLRLVLNKGQGARSCLSLSLSLSLLSNTKPSKGAISPCQAVCKNKCKVIVDGRFLRACVPSLWASDIAHDALPLLWKLQSCSDCHGPLYMQQAAAGQENELLGMLHRLRDQCQREGCLH